MMLQEKSLSSLISSRMTDLTVGFPQGKFGCSAARSSEFDTEVFFIGLHLSAVLGDNSWKFQDSWRKLPCKRMN